MGNCAKAMNMRMGLCRINAFLFIGITGLIFHSKGANAQEGVSLEAYKAKYPNEQLVQLELTERVDIATGSKGVTITTKHVSKVLYLTDRAQEYAEKHVYSDSFDVITDVEAYTMQPGPKGYKKADKADIAESHSVDGDFFYDDRQEKKITFPGLKAGSISILNYTDRATDPHFLSGFYFQEFMPLEKSLFEVSVPPGVKLKFKVFGDSSYVRHSTRKEGKNTIYVWTSENVPKLSYESDAPSFRLYMPHVQVYIEEYEGAKGNVKVYSDVSGLYAWYTTLLKDNQIKPDANIIRITDSIINGATTQYEKTKRIFYWVQDHIHYIAIENGLGGYIPRQAAAVCNKRYGDCKDMANLLVVMLQHAGVKASHVWIGTRDIPYTYSELPTNATDNHMIALAEVDGEKLFLDATGKYIPLGLPTPMIQGKEALVGRGKDKFEIMKIDLVSKEKNAVNDTTWLTLDGDVLKGKATTVYKGFSKYSVTSRLAHYSKKELREKMDDILERGNNKCRIDDATWSGLMHRDSNFITNYSFSIPQYAYKNGDEVYVNMYLDKPLKSGYIDTSMKKLDMEYEYKYLYTTQTVLNVPDGYTVVSVPNDAAYKGKEYGFETKFVKEKNKVILKQSTYADALVLYRKDFQDWNKMVKSLQEAYRQTVVLKKVK
jgi:transglutaminase-like putative cysteine protease